MLTLQSLYLLAVQTGIITVTATLLILPAIMELKKSKDSGPRLIKDSLESTRIASFRIAVDNLDDEGTDKLAAGLASYLCRFPNLEI